ncbi:TPA: hypothetical protein JAN03_24365 [Citrobacter freundii]|nr:hypothetical protein [Citrobacter freundii]HAT6805134.1 hypothetical protein [Citrobacter freundii]
MNVNSADMVDRMTGVLNADIMNSGCIMSGQFSDKYIVSDFLLHRVQVFQGRQENRPFFF